MLQNFYVTFGMMYRYENHPHWPSAHPDGWLEVKAPDYEAARELVARYIGNVYAFLYEERAFKPQYHERGRLATITPDGVEPVEGVEPPTPLPAEEPTREIVVSWYETTHYSAVLDVPAGFDPEQDDADQVLEALICELSSERMDDAFTGTTDRVIIDREWMS